MGIIWTIIIGFIVGLFARAIVPGRNISGFIMTTLLGIGELSLENSSDRA